MHVGIRRTGGYDVHCFHLGELSIPDKLALKATKLVAEVSSISLPPLHEDFLICQFNRATAGNEIDRELLYLGAI